VGRQLRIQESGSIYFVTNRCSEARFFLRPDARTTQIILDVLAYVASKYSVEIFGFIFMSNHFHMLLRAAELDLERFMRDFQSQLARRLNLRWGRSHTPFGDGSFFPQRFTSPVILDDEEVIAKLCYTLCNPCLSNLVRHPNRWPGLSSWSIHTSGEPLVGTHAGWRDRQRVRRKHPEWDDEEVRKEAAKTYALELAKLPMWADLDDEAYHAKVRELVQEHALGIDKQRKGRCMGPEAILSQHFNDSPASPKVSSKPVCLASDPELKIEYKKQIREITDRYHEAVDKLRQGKTDVEFPHGTIPPGHACCVGSARPRDALPTAA
jgi:putative transposase